MFVIGNKVLCIGSKGAIDKFVVIRVFRDKSKTEMWVNKCDIFPVQNKQYDVLGNAGCRLLLNNLMIFFQYLIGYTKLEFACKKSIPYWTIRTVQGNHLNETVGVNDYMSHRENYL